MSLASGHAEASAAKRLRSSPVLGSLLPSNAEPAQGSQSRFLGSFTDHFDGLPTNRDLTAWSDDKFRVADDSGLISELSIASSYAD
jgi:hypothetical protein